MTPPHLSYSLSSYQEPREEFLELVFTVFLVRSVISSVLLFVSLVSEYGVAILALIDFQIYLTACNAGVNLTSSM